MMGAMDLDEAEAKTKVEALFISDDATRRRVICALIGHSHIVDDRGCLQWDIHCARCGEQLPKVVIDFCVFVQHPGCYRCRKAQTDLTWRDTWEVQLGQTDGRS